MSEKGNDVERLFGSMGLDASLYRVFHNGIESSGHRWTSPVVKRAAEQVAEVPQPELPRERLEPVAAEPQAIRPQVSVAEAEEQTSAAAALAAAKAAPAAAMTPPAPEPVEPVRQQVAAADSTEEVPVSPRIVRPSLSDSLRERLQDPADTVERPAEDAGSHVEAVEDKLDRVFSRSRTASVPPSSAADGSDGEETIENKLERAFSRLRERSRDH